MSLPSIYIKRRLEGVYAELCQSVLALKDACLSQAIFRTDFFRAVEDWSNNFVYQRADKSEFRVCVWGEIQGSEAGTILSSKGNHYAGKAGGPFLPVTDGSKAKNVLVIGCPTNAPEDLEATFRNQIAGLNDIRIEDEQEELKSGVAYRVKEWIKNAENDASVMKDLIVLHLPPIYKAPNKYNRGEKQGRIVRVPTSAKSGEHEDGEVKSGALYDPHMLPDFGGPCFGIEEAKLVQHEIYDVENNLVAPWNVYETLKKGTIVMAECTLHCYNMDGNMRTYQINADSVRVVAISDEEAVIPKQPNVPDGPVSTVGKKRQNTEYVASKAFQDFKVPTGVTAVEAERRSSKKVKLDKSSDAKGGTTAKKGGTK